MREFVSMRHTDNNIYAPNPNSNPKRGADIGRKTSWAKDVWANYFLGDRRLGDNSHFKKDVRRKTVGRQRPKQFASQCSTLLRNSVVRATIKVNEKPPILGSQPIAP